MAISNIETVTDQYIVDSESAESAVKEVINTLRSDLHADALSTLKEVRSNVFTFSGGETSFCNYVYKAYVECFFGEFRVTKTFYSVDKQA